MTVAKNEESKLQNWRSSMPPFLWYTLSKYDVVLRFDLNLNQYSGTSEVYLWFGDYKPCYIYFLGRSIGFNPLYFVFFRLIMLLQNLKIYLFEIKNKLCMGKSIWGGLRVARKLDSICQTLAHSAVDLWITFCVVLFVGWPLHSCPGSLSIHSCDLYAWVASLHAFQWQHAASIHVTESRGQDLCVQKAGAWCGRNQYSRENSRRKGQTWWSAAAALQLF